MSRPLLILMCSAAKRPDPAPLPAQQRYTGALWQIYHAYARRDPAGAARIRVAVLSAEHGLIDGATPIATYDRKMDAARAAALRPQVFGALGDLLLARPPAVCVAASAVYLAALPDLAGLPVGHLTVTHGGIGVKRGLLGAWLRVWGAPPVRRTFWEPYYVVA